MFIVDIQGFQFKDSEYFIKEIAIYNLDTHIVNHTFIRPPNNSSWFSPSVKRHMQWLCNNIHGLDWDDNWFDNDVNRPQTIPLERIENYIHSIIGDCIIMVKGLNKKKILENFLSNIIIDIDKFSCLNLNTLKNDIICDYHCNFHLNNSLNCAKRNVHLLYNWFIK